MKLPYAIGSVPSLSGHAIAYRWRSLPRVRQHKASKSQDSSERVLPWQVTMDQLIFASLSHTHYWYEVGMLKVPAVCVMSGLLTELLFGKENFGNLIRTSQLNSHTEYIPRTEEIAREQFEGFGLRIRKKVKRLAMRRNGRRAFRCWIMQDKEAR